MSQRESKTRPNIIGGLVNKNDVPPHEGAFDLSELVRGVIGVVRTHVVISNASALAVALWIIGAWCYRGFSRFPLLLINAPERECGKTQLLKVVEMLVFRPLETANITMAALFRIINEYGPTLLIDEADTFMDGKGEMAGIINNGYQAGGVVMRVETDRKGQMECCPYLVYGPKALAGITLERHLQAATMSRGIQIPMKRKTKTDKVARLRTADPAVFADLRSRICRFVRDHQEVLAKGWDELPEQLGDRQQDNWAPLLAIAHCLGPEWYAKAVEAAVEISAETAPPKSSSNQLLEDIRAVLQGYQGMYVPSAYLLELLHGDADMDWCRYNHGQPLTARQLARFLAPYDIKSKTVRMGNLGTTPKGYELRLFKEAFDRYLPDLPSGPDADDAPTASQFAPVIPPKNDPGMVFMYGEGGRPLPPAEKPELPAKLPIPGL